jgi:hypothetical protein
MPPPVTLTPEQIAYMTDQFNAAGALATPPYAFDTYESLINKLLTNVKEIGGTKTMGEGIRTKQGWNTDDAEFRQAVEDAIHETNKDWGPFP